jgi:hypothetical protein
MKNLGQMLRQAQTVQGKMQEFQAGLIQVEVSGAAGAGMVTVTLNGKGEMRGLKIAPDLAAPGEIKVLEDLIVTAHNDAKGKVEALVAEEMAKITGGLQLPAGLKLPF